MELVMRNAVIVKKVEFKVPYGGWQSSEPSKKSNGFIYIDTISREVGFMLGSGTAPTTDMVMYAMMADQDVCRLAKEYSNGKRKYPFEIICHERISGAEDWYIKLYSHFGDANICIGKKHLLHISGCGKVNENIKPMYIGDFVELFVTLMNPSIPFNRKIIRDKLQSGFGFKYIYEAPHGDITTRCSNIFE